MKKLSRLSQKEKVTIVYLKYIENKKIKKLQKELKDCQLDRDSKNDQIDMLKSAIKNKNKEVDGLNEGIILSIINRTHKNWYSSRKISRNERALW